MKLLIPAVLIAQALYSQSFEAPVAASNPYPPLDMSGRLNWAFHSTFDTGSLFSIAAQSALKTWTNSPREYGPHWDGFGKRVATGYGVSIISDTMEASTGALWGEDPRYRRKADGSKVARLGYAVKMAFMAERASGEVKPAYARFIGVSSAQLISNSWRPPSETGAGDTTLRIGLGFARRVGGNAFSEFWPDLKRRFRHRNTGAATPGSEQ